MTARRRKLALAIVAVLLGIAIVLLTQVGLYSVQPIGVLHDGMTLLVWRNKGDPFFNSPDAVCLQRLGYVSLFCRALAIGEVPKGNRIILRLPYWEFAYRESTSGQEFEK